VFSRVHLSPGTLVTKPDEAPDVQNERFMNVCDGTSENQWSKTPNALAIPLSTGTYSGV
jgi:hypothetical protein